MLAAMQNRARICELLLTAGAKRDLVDPSGQTALALARAVEASEAASALAVFELAPEPDPDGGICATGVPYIKLEVTQAATEHGANFGCDTTQALAELAIAAEEASTSGVEVPVGPDLLGFDLDGWEAEVERPPPEIDAAVTAVAQEVQRTITSHRPIDTSARWDDFDAFLPERATPLPRGNDTEVRQSLRLVLLRAVREGSVPQLALDEVTFDENGAPNAEAAAVLRLAINDLGADVDERFEYVASHESLRSM
jgi:RNA polymerase primary sigma factor